MDKAFLEGHGYKFPHQLPDGRWVALLPQFYNDAIVVIEDDYGNYSEKW